MVAGRIAADYSVLILSEDGSRHAFDVIQHMFVSALKVVHPRLETQRIVFSPPSIEARSVLSGNVWKAKDGSRYEYLQLVRAIAEKVAEPNGFVVFHFDGDVPWSLRSSGQNTALFDLKIRQAAYNFLEFKRDAVFARERQSRILRLVPYYSIEAWLYQATGQAISLCELHYSGRDRAKFLEWSLDRSRLDEVIKPKEQTCLGSNYNATLARSFPEQDVAAADASFMAAATELLKCDDLIQMSDPSTS